MSGDTTNTAIIVLFIFLIIFCIYKISVTNEIHNIKCYYDKNVIFYNGELYYKDFTTNELKKCKK